MWNVETGRLVQKFTHHTDAITDSDWYNNKSFATCSMDGNVHVMTLGSSTPVRSFIGHKGDVNCIRWDPTHRLIASAGDDTTARVWTMDDVAEKDAFGAEEIRWCLFVLRGHTREIYALEWAPVPGPNGSRILATYV